MPTRYQKDGTPVVEFDPFLEVSPFELFRRMRENDRPLLIDVRPMPARHTLRGAQSFEGNAWRPPEATDVVLFDDDGSLAMPIGRRLQAEGFDNVRVLFGGLDLWAFALDPQVVGQETFLEPVPPAG